MFVGGIDLFGKALDVSARAPVVDLLYKATRIDNLLWPCLDRRKLRVEILNEINS